MVSILFWGEIACAGPRLRPDDIRRRVVDVLPTATAAVLLPTVTN